MKKMKPKLDAHLKAIAPRLKDAEPGFRVPQFKTDEEELAWLDQNYERLADLTAKHGKKVQFKLVEPTKQISIRLPVRDLERSKEIAVARKISYQAVLKQALRTGLAAESGRKETGIEKWRKEAPSKIRVVEPEPHIHFGRRGMKIHFEQQGTKTDQEEPHKDQKAGKRARI
jgi:predicted DNA binding CopG/RHH family protein